MIGQATLLRHIKNPDSTTDRRSRTIDLGESNPAPLGWTCPGQAWRSVKGLHLRYVTAGYGLANRPITTLATLRIKRWAVSWPALAAPRRDRPLWRRLKDSNPQTTNGNGFLDRSATNYGISRRVPAFTGRPQAAPAFYLTLRFNAGEIGRPSPRAGPS